MPQVTLISPITKQSVAKKRVAAYCRVSSASADQQNSYSRQVRTYTKLIESRKDWELVEVFADDAISGMSAENRPDFQRMLQMCYQHKVDLILTKSVSRFARNVKEALEIVRQLKRLGIGVQFEKEGINTLSLGDEMLLNTFTAIAQEESKAISQHQRNSISHRMDRGEYVDNNAPYGYRTQDKKLVVYEPEAEIVKEIFKAYLSGQSTEEIARNLNARGIPTKTGKERWRSKQIAYMLSNERYMGDCLYQKTYRDTTVPFKQYKNRGQEDQFYAKGTHEAIIAPEIFEQTKQLLLKRHADHSRTVCFNIYPLTSRIRCAECGSIFYRKVTGGCIKWVCSRHKNDFAACDSNYYSEERIYDGLVAMVNKLRFGSIDILGTVIGKLELADTLYKKNNTLAAQISQTIAELNSKRLMLEQLHAKGYLASEVYESQLRALNIEINEKKQTRLSTFESRIQDMLEKVRKLKSLIWEIEEPLETFQDTLFAEIVSDITINRRDEMTVTLLGGMRFTERI